ncbi:MAG: CocE/NonD family hydrolase [Parvibaculaceae bacterium]
MSDGTRIAVDIWLPETYSSGQTLPAILYMTRYQRAQQIGWLQRAFIGLGLTSSDGISGLPVDLFNASGIAFIKVDARGSGASFGRRDIEMSPEEIADYGEIAQWVTQQPWSNGKIGAVGVSYAGNTAELITATQHPAIKAVAPLYNDFDAQFGLVQPGGAKSAFLDSWGDFVGKLDRNDVCALADANGLKCLLVRFWSPGVKPVDGSDGPPLLKAALEEHLQNTPVAEGFSKINFRDDTFGSTQLTSAAVSGYGLRREIEASGVVFHVRTGWLDAATTDGALSRYRTFSNSQKLIIGPYSHGGATDTDPFSAPDAPAIPTREEQWRDIVQFFVNEFSEHGTHWDGKSIEYYTMGAGIWRNTTSWPPQGLTEQTFYFDRNGILATKVPGVERASDVYTVDISASSGGHTRWHTNLGLGDVVYPDRKNEDSRLLTYTSAPLATSMEITGTPVLTFFVSTNKQDGVFHAYLEAVAPNGRVIYLTEGILRAQQRKITSANLPYFQDGPPHSYLREDALPVVPGKEMEISIGLYATSIVVPKDYRLRIALAGADLAMFKPLPEDNASPEWTVFYGSARPSRLILPSREYPQ